MGIKISSNFGFSCPILIYRFAFVVCSERETINQITLLSTRP